LTKYTAEDVQNILETLGDDFIVDVPASFTDGAYKIGFTDLAIALTSSEPDWYADIAYATNARLGGLV